MPSAEIAFTTPADAPAWKRWLLCSPVARILVFAVLMVASFMLVGGVLHAVGLAGRGLAPAARGWGELLARAIPTLFAYLVLVFTIERRRPRELAPRALLPDVLRGIALGTLILAVVMGVLWLAGAYRVEGVGGHVDWLGSILMVGAGAGISEEIVFRGVLFRIVEEGLGTWAALAVSALAFGLIHLGNPNATLWSSAAIAIEAGVLLGLAYHVTRSLWFCMGLHAAWNVMEGPVFGTPVSGLPPQGWVRATLEGPAWLSGGTFGPEASVVTPVVCLLVAGVLLAIALRRGTLVAPAWMRRRATGT